MTARAGRQAHAGCEAPTARRAAVAPMEDETMTRLFEVTVEVKLFVAAEDADDAAEWAEDNADEWWPDVSAGSAYAREATRVPTGHASDLPWLADGVVADDRCIAEWIEGGE